MKKLIYLISIVILLGSCTGFQRVTVKKNHHYPNKIFAPTNSLRVEADIKFNKNCAWEFTKPVFNYTNKLYGLSPLFRSNHWNSGRFTWRYNEDHERIDIWYYIYINGVSPQDNPDQKGYMFTVSLDEWNNYVAIDYLDKYEFYKNDSLFKTYYTPKRKEYNSVYREGLWVGGDYTYDVDISVDYKIKK